MGAELHGVGASAQAPSQKTPAAEGGVVEGPLNQTLPGLFSAAALESLTVGGGLQGEP